MQIEISDQSTDTGYTLGDMLTLLPQSSDLKHTYHVEKYELLHFRQLVVLTEVRSLLSLPFVVPNTVCDIVLNILKLWLNLCISY